MAAAEMDDDYKADVSSLLEVNRLDYRLPPSLSIATSRAEKHYPALNQSTVMGNPIIFTLSSGASYLDLLNSYISFYVQFTGDAITTVRMPSHVGWANMFQKYIVIHSSGVELDRQNDSVGEMIQIQNYYNRSQQKRRIQGSLYGLNDCPYPMSVLRDTGVAFSQALDQTWVRPISGGAGALTIFPDGTNTPIGFPQTNQSWMQKYNITGQPVDLSGGFSESRDVVASTSGGISPPTTVPARTQAIQVTIPLAHIAGIFDVDLLSPSFLAAGMRIELYTYPKEHFFQLIGVPNPGAVAPLQVGQPTVSAWGANNVVTILNPTINVESFTLTDSIVRKLSQISSQSGLEWYWDAVHQTSLATSQKSQSIQVSRALSRANNAIVKSRSSSNLGNAAADSFASDPWDLIGFAGANDLADGTMQSYQVQLGAQYIPALPIVTTPQYLHSALKTFNQFRRSDEVGGPPLWDFRGLLTVGSVDATRVDITYGGLAVSAVPLESSSTLQQSGAAISAQRTAVVNMEWVNSRDNTHLRRVDLFVMYSKLATLFLDSVVVRS